MLRKSLFTLIALLVTAGFASAEVPANWKDYFDGPAGFLLTKKEKKEWKKRVKTAAQAEEFIELFWAKRDPDLETPLNEFEQDFDLRVEAADEAFTWEDSRGAMTDRGKVLILLGRPVERVERAPEVNTGVERSAGGGVEQPGIGSGGSGTPFGSPSGPPAGVSPPPSQEEVRSRGAIEAWAYDPRSLPVEINQRVLLVMFREDRLGRGDFQFVRESPRNTLAQRVISAAPDLLLRHPDLTEVPRYGLIQGTEPAVADQLAWFEGEASWPEGAGLVAKEGLVTGPRHFIWTHLYLPSNAPEEAVAVGRLRDASSGEQVGTFQKPVQAIELRDGFGYELSVPVGKGSWTLDLALADQGRPLAVTSIDLETTDVPLDSTVFAPIYWGANIVQYEEPKLSDPFCVGGWHVVPRFTDVYGKGEDLSYMAYILQPDVERGSQPQFTTVITLYKGERRLVRGQPQPAQLSQVAPDMWMVSGGIDLGRIPEPGDYRLEVELKQASDDATLTTEIPFTIQGGEESAEEAPAEATE